MDLISILAGGTYFSLLGASAWTDLRTGRIPNALTVTGFGLALGLRAFGGLDPLLAGLAGAGLALAVTLPFFALGAIGGGDAKLLIAVGAFLGPGHLATALLATAVAGGLLSLVHAARRGVILPALLNVRSLVGHWFSLGRSGDRPTLESPGAISVPYGVAIAAGSFAAWFLNPLW